MIDVSFFDVTKVEVLAVQHFPATAERDWEFWSQTLRITESGGKVHQVKFMCVEDPTRISLVMP